MSKKRKDLADEIATSDNESDGEFGETLEGILSQSEDDSEEEDDSEGDFDEEDEEEGAESGLEALSDVEDLGLKNLTTKDEANYTVETDANGNERYVYKEIEVGYDSDDSDAPENENTIGNIPLSFYDSYPHIGYNINGKRIMRPAKGEALDALVRWVVGHEECDADCCCSSIV